MKNTVLIIIISLFSINALAQIDASGGLDEKLSFGLKLGVGSSIISFNDARYDQISSNGLGHFSAFLNKPITNKFALQAGLSYTDRGFSALEQPSATNPFAQTMLDLRLFYLEIPINGVFKLPLGKGKVVLGGGPYIGYALDGSVEKLTTDFSSSSFIYKEEERKLAYGNKTTDDFKKTDVGFNFLAGYQFRKGWLLNINYAQGIQNILPKELITNDEKAINTALHFCVGYEF
ncbi:porin family protein [Pedobacter alpinus]|uniref:Porin family protein n=1 Tax=Pedobacter alpinus TaxID=1590643 RepID=A0ABW5TWZ0_9SPHI